MPITLDGLGQNHCRLASMCHRQLLVGGDRFFADVVTTSIQRPDISIRPVGNHFGLSSGVFAKEMFAHIGAILLP
jgi:hypothetical protein